MAIAFTKGTAIPCIHAIGIASFGNFQELVNLIVFVYLFSAIVEAKYFLLKLIHLYYHQRILLLEHLVRLADTVNCFLFLLLLLGIEFDFHAKQIGLHANIRANLEFPKNLNYLR